MDIIEAMEARHSVRQYQDKAISPEHTEALQKEINACNEESGLRIQLISDDPDCFNSLWAHYGKFKNARHYLAFVGKDEPLALEKCGYYGERLVLFAQQLGLNTCWVAGSYKKKNCSAEVSDYEKIFCVISIGYGENQGKKHRSKAPEKLYDLKGAEMPDWFRRGLQAAILAPTAINQQQFLLVLDGEEAKAVRKPGPFSRIDIGIVAYHFEAASGHRCRMEG